MENSNYYLALTVIERINALKSKGIELETDDIFLDRWINIRGLSTIKETQEMCNMQGINIKEFTYALKNFDSYEKEILDEATFNSEWYKKIEDVMDNYNKVENKLEELSVSVVYPVRPFILYSLTKISENCKELKNIEISLDAWNKISEWLSSSLSDIIIKVITLDLHGYKLKNEEKTDENLFSKYMKENFGQQAQLEKFYNEYPVMTRLIVKKMEYLINHANNIFSRLDHNYQWVKEKTNNKELIVSDIKIGEGDTHSSGQTVSIIEFSNNKKIVYKPKNLIVEKKFNELLDRINKKKYSEIVEMEYVQSLYEDKYTLSEYIEAKPCTDEEQVKLYYRRLGQILFIIHTINGNDFHFENIISSGGQAYLIDIETVFQVAMADMLAKLDTPEGAIYKKYTNGVLSIGILPLLGFNQNSEGKSVDISALNGGKQKLPFKVLSLKNANTENMIFEYDYPELSDTNNIPILNNEKMPYKNYKDCLSYGFEKMAEFILDNKEEYLKLIGDIFNDNNIVVRQLTKATANYATLLQYRNHPNYLKDMIYMERLFENLMSYPYNDKRIVLAEIKDMIFGDIPIFFSKLTDKNVICSDGRIIENYFYEEPFNRVINKIKSLSESNINEEKWMFMNSVGILKDEKRKLIEEINKEEKLDSNIEIDTVKEILEKINNGIVSQRVFGNNEDDFNWVSYKLGNVKYEPIGYGYESGMSGVATYFYFLDKISHKNEYTSVFDAIIEKMSKISKKMYEKDLNQLSDIVMFSLCKDRHSKVYYEYLEYIVSVVDKLISEEIRYTREQVNILIKCILQYYKNENNPELLDKAKKLFDKYNNYNELTIEELLFFLDKDMTLFAECKEWVMSNIVEYAEEIVSKDLYSVWRNAKLDTVSNGVLYIVNNLIDISVMTGEDKYYEYASGLLGISLNSYREHGAYRMFTQDEHIDVSLDEGYSGLAYTILRVYAKDQLPNIFNLNTL